ncbi:hypothetical protein [Leucobacter salsicius]|uniref:hypothetical protein n=1 Tax=Leucobacter salsicius TaxID=664638 RepID=UPI00035DF76A|nr:hypothetical protein [Leucobacter salsicius]
MDQRTRDGVELVLVVRFTLGDEVCREDWSAAKIDQTPEGPPVTASALVRGDPMSLLPAEQLADGERPRGLLWGLDLSACRSRTEGRATRHAGVEGLKACLDAHPSVRRVCLAVLRPEGLPASLRVRVPSGLATRLHADLERDRARDVQCLTLDLTGCRNPELLAVRLEEVFASPSGFWSDLTIDWETFPASPFDDLVAAAIL